MLDAFYISAIGLQAQKAQLDAVADNLANLGTTAYKRQFVDFSAILDPSAPGNGTDATSETRPIRRLRFDLAPGAIHSTGRPLDLAISGDGFIEVELPDSRTGYTRGGSLQINADGGLSLLSGQPLKADIRIPGDARDVQVLADGSVTAVLSGESTPTVLGQIELATFATPDALQYRGEGVFIAPEGMEPTHTRPGEQGTQQFAAQSLEGANVDMTNEMVSLMLMQRAYELNSRVVQVADELMGMSNNLIRA
jgi:flagellar basal-body rod protein FlgG